MDFSLTQTQLSGMGDALTQGGSSLLNVGIQVMPYAIAFTIIFIIFTLIKNWSNLKNRGLGGGEPMYSRGQYRMNYPGATKKEYRAYKRFYRNN